MPTSGATIEDVKASNTYSNCPSSIPEQNKPKDEDKTKDEDYYSRYSHFPIKHQILEDYYQKHKSSTWFDSEIDFAEDRHDWEEKLDKNSKRFLKFILCFFAQADGIVNENLVDNFIHETSVVKEAGKFYRWQAAMEQIHNETYSKLIEAFFRSREEKIKAYNAIHHYPSIRKISEWVFKWMDTDKPLAERIVAFACVEGIFFSSAFAAIYWIKKKNILKGLCQANEFIARDEALHTEFAIALYHIITGVENLSNSLSKEVVHSIISSATSTAEEFTREALRVDLIGMNAEEMIRYVKCTSDRLSISLGYGKIFNETNPFEWMDVIALPNKANFFETRVSEYGRQETSQSQSDAFDFDLETDF